MNQRASELLQERTIKTQAVVTLLGKVSCLYHEIMDSTRELAEMAKESNPDRKVLVRETLNTIGVDRLSSSLESSLKSLLAHEPPLDLLADCERGNNTLRLTIGS